MNDMAMNQLWATQQAKPGEKDAEIERLEEAFLARASKEVQKMIADKDAEIERLKFLNKEERETIDELSTLCTRAADALEKESWPSEHHDYSGLIAELRKAADNE